MNQSPNEVTIAAEDLVVRLQARHELQLVRMAREQAQLVHEIAQLETLIAQQQAELSAAKDRS
jgi:hypothetical protein